MTLIKPHFGRSDVYAALVEATETYPLDILTRIRSADRLGIRYPIRDSVHPVGDETYAALVEAVTDGQR